MKNLDPIHTRHDVDIHIAGRSRRGDVLFTERRGRAASRKRLGLLGDLARGEVLFEALRPPFSHVELEDCVTKAVDLRAARRAGRKLSTVVGPSLCVIAPSMSADLADAADARPVPGGPPGLYTLAPMWRTTIVVVDELPRDASTLWLRLLGRGAVQAGAMKELLEMDEEEPLREGTLELLVGWRESLPASTDQSEEEREMAMNLDRIYEGWEQKIKAEGKAEAVLTVLDGRGLTVTAAQRKQVLACTDLALLDVWLRGAGTTASVKALLAGGAAPRPREKRSRSAA